MSTFAPIPGVKVIGLGHRARNGKDSVASWFMTYHPQRSRIYGFADALKMHCRVEHGMTEKDGPLLQRVGGAFRDKDPEVWIRALYYRLNEERPSYAFISDVRHTNEAEFVKSLGGVLIRVSRFLPDGTPFIDPSRDPNHPSECELQDYTGWDYTIKNDGSLQKLCQEADEAWHEVVE